MESETAKNDDWELHADNWLSITKAEFDKVDKSRKIPVLVTAERIMQFLYSKVPSAKEIYKGEVEVPFWDNGLGRPLFALYRHYEYSLYKYNQYSMQVQDYLK